MYIYIVIQLLPYKLFIESQKSVQRVGWPTIHFLRRDLYSKTRVLQRSSNKIKLRI